MSPSQAPHRRIRDREDDDDFFFFGEEPYVPGALIPVVDLSSDEDVYVAVGADSVDEEEEPMILEVVNWNALLHERYLYVMLKFIGGPFSSHPPIS